jgi:hypothetical protein
MSLRDIAECFFVGFIDGVGGGVVGGVGLILLVVLVLY